MENLFVIGNSFDIAHGLPTSYCCFKNFLRKEAKIQKTDEELLKLPLFDTTHPYYGLCSDNAGNMSDEELARFYYHLLLKISILNDDLEWNQFEENLAEIYRLPDWQELAENMEKVAYIMETVYPEATQRLFLQWIEGISLKNTKAIKETITSHKEDSYFLTFNYTNVLEEIYHVPEERICHIHLNQTKEGENEVIVGHSGDVSRDFQKLKESPSRSYLDRTVVMVEKNTQSQLSKNYAFLEKLQSVRNIYCLGHSLAKVDELYFRELFSRLGEVNLFIDEFHYHNGREDKEIVSRLQKYGARLKKVTILDKDRTEIAVDRSNEERLVEENIRYLHVNFMDGDAY
ncbi:bacteriophage abortive infection AbiH family protein [Streptococcus thoraltensis]